MTEGSPVVPAEAYEVKCTVCGADAIVNPNYTAEVREEDGKTNVWLICSDEDCTWKGGLFSWQVTREEYKAHFGQVPAGVLPSAPEERVLPPGPWGYFKVQPAPIPDEAWEVTCPNNVGRWPRTRECGAYLIPNPADGVFYFDEFTSTASLGFRCEVCRKPVLENMTWSLTPEQHQALFGRAVGEYRPSFDPEDPDDFEAKYSMWRTEDQGLLMHFRDLDDLIASEDVDLLALGPGDFTIKHWSTGGEWDAPDFVAEYRERITAAYQDVEEGYDGEGDYEDE